MHQFVVIGKRVDLPMQKNATLHGLAESRNLRLTDKIGHPIPDNQVVVVEREVKMGEMIQTRSSKKV